MRFNRHPCAAHSFQLSVRRALKNLKMEDSITKVRQTCKFYRLSATGSLYLQKQQILHGALPLRLTLDVRTRWVSTLFMLKRFLKIQKHVEEATAKLYQDSFKFVKLEPGVPMSGRETIALQECVQAIEQVEEATSLLVTEKTPSLRRNDPVTASIVQNASFLTEKKLNRRLRLRSFQSL